MLDGFTDHRHYRALPKFRPCRRRILITILVVDRQLPDIDDAELQYRRRKFGKRLGHFSVD
jgi:hypothetical protein